MASERPGPDGNKSFGEVGDNRPGKPEQVCPSVDSVIVDDCTPRNSRRHRQTGNCDPVTDRPCLPDPNLRTPGDPLDAPNPAFSGRTVRNKVVTITCPSGSGGNITITQGTLTLFVPYNPDPSSFELSVTLAQQQVNDLADQQAKSLITCTVGNSETTLECSDLENDGSTLVGSPVTIPANRYTRELRGYDADLETAQSEVDATALAAANQQLSCRWLSQEYSVDCDTSFPGWDIGPIALTCNPEGSTGSSEIPVEPTNNSIVVPAGQFSISYPYTGDGTPDADLQTTVESYASDNLECPVVYTMSCQCTADVFVAAGGVSELSGSINCLTAATTQVVSLQRLDIVTNGAGYYTYTLTTGPLYGNLQLLVDCDGFIAVESQDESGVGQGDAIDIYNATSGNTYDSDRHALVHANTFVTGSAQLSMDQAVNTAFAQRDCLYKNVAMCATCGNESGISFEESTPGGDAPVCENFTDPNSPDDSPSVISPVYVNEGVYRMPSQEEADSLARSFLRGALVCLWYNATQAGASCPDPDVTLRPFTMPKGKIVSTVSAADANVLAKSIADGNVICQSQFPPVGGGGDGGLDVDIEQTHPFAISAKITSTQQDGAWAVLLISVEPGDYKTEGGTNVSNISLSGTNVTRADPTLNVYLSVHLSPAADKEESGAVADKDGRYWKSKAGGRLVLTRDRVPEFPTLMYEGSDPVFAVHIGSVSVVTHTPESGDKVNRITINQIVRDNVVLGDSSAAIAIESIPKQAGSIILVNIYESTTQEISYGDIFDSYNNESDWSIEITIPFDDANAISMATDTETVDFPEQQSVTRIPVVRNNKIVLRYGTYNLSQDVLNGYLVYVFR